MQGIYNEQDLHREVISWQLNQGRTLLRSAQWQIQISSNKRTNQITYTHIYVALLL